jgi:AcrR family transcriptional regulator
VTEARSRRTQAERSAATRSVLLDSAIKSLFDNGYGATSTITVAEKAGLSRGAMLHQFPTKSDLMTFVVEAVFEQEVDLYHELLHGITDPRQRLLAYPQAVWTVLSRPAGVAVLEIIQGSRSDAALAEKLAPTLAKISAVVRRELASEFPKGPSLALLELIVGAVRGLSIQKVLTPDDEGVNGAIPLLQELLRVGLEAGALGRAGARKGEPEEIEAEVVKARSSKTVKARSAKTSRPKAAAVALAAGPRTARRKT